MDQKKIGSFLKELRMEKGMTQEKLAERFNVSGRTVSRWECGNNMPDISLLADLADFYEVDVREIIDGERKQNMPEEIREVAEKMAEYAKDEKGRLFRWVQAISLFGTVVMVIVIGLQCGQYEQKTSSLIAIVLSFVALVAMAITTLYANGILKKLVKRKLFVVLVRVIVILLLVIGFRFMVAFWLLTGIALLDMSTPPTVNSGIENYNKEALVEEYHGDLDSLFMTFPDDLDHAVSAEFASKLKTGLFDTDGYLVLEVTYEAENFEKEVSRLSEISCRIVNGMGDESVTNEIRYDTESYKYPAYVASDGYDDVYEYALINEDEHQIIYVLLSYPNTAQLVKYNDYIKKNPLDYKKNEFTSSLEEFSIYSHKFDDGLDAWTEAEPEDQE